MPAYTDKFRRLVQMYREAEIRYPGLKAMTLAQWINESGRGSSQLAEGYNNFAGLKWREEMVNWARPVAYTDHAGESDTYCHFPGLADFILGYWVFLGRDVYDGWEVHADDPAGFMDYIGSRYNPGDAGYGARVVGLLPEATALLEDEPLVPAEGDGAVHPPGSAHSPRYTVRYYKGDYKERQEKANADQCIAYVEQHFNCCLQADGYSVAITATNASRTSRNWGRWYAKAIAREFNTRTGGDDGIVVGGYNGRGNYNLYHTAMPAILLEPLFASDPAQAAVIRSADGQERLGRVLAESVRNFFPQGGLVAFSVGHKYKTSSPGDLGTEVVGGGYEADYAEAVLRKAERFLAGA